MSNLVHVFVSFTTQDLKSYREVVTGAVLSRGAHPVVKEHFAPSHRVLADNLERCRNRVKYSTIAELIHHGKH